MTVKQTQIGMWLACLFLPFISYGYQPLTSHLIVTGGLGFSTSQHHPDNTFVISPYITDSLNGFEQNFFPSLTLSVKEKFSFNYPYLTSITVGPTFYYQRIRYKGAVWELLAPEFSNYTYHFTSENFPLLLEGDFAFNPFCQRIYPFVTLGVGVVMVDVNYTERATVNIDPASELHLNNQQFNLAYDFGLGLAYAIDNHWEASFKYTYMHLGNADSGTATPVRIQQPVRIKLDTQNIFFAISYAV